MDKYFWNYSTPNHKKLPISLGHLIREALKWWDDEEYTRWSYKEPEIKTLEELKLLMRSIYPPTSLRTMHQTIPQSKEAIWEDNTSKRVSQRATMQHATQGEFSKSKNPLELTCYKCKDMRHIAKDCPMKKRVQPKLGCAPQENLNQQHHDLKGSIKDAKLYCDSIMQDYEWIKRMIL